MRIHIKNDHASPETSPPAPEGEAVFAITRERFAVVAVPLTLELVFRNLERLLEGKPIENVVRPELGC